MDVGRRRADEENGPARSDAAIDLGRQDVAAERRAQGDQVDVRRQQQARQLVERDRRGPHDRRAGRPQAVGHLVGVGARAVDPQGEAIGAAAMAPREPFKDRLDVVDDAEVARIEQGEPPSEAGRAGEGSLAAREHHR